MKNEQLSLEALNSYNKDCLTFFNQQFFILKAIKIKATKPINIISKTLVRIKLLTKKTTKNKFT